MKKFIDRILLDVKLNLFAGNTNITSDSGLTDEMKTYYSTYLIRLAERFWFTTSSARSIPSRRPAAKPLSSASMTAFPRRPRR